MNLTDLIKEQEELLNSIPTDGYNQEWVDKAEECLKKSNNMPNITCTGLELITAGNNHDRIQDELEMI